MIKRFAEGLNYSIDVDGPIASCRVWSRPDLSSAEGAALAQEKVSLFQQLAQGPARALLFDLAQAPVVTGPRTQQALGEMLSAWQAAGKPIAVIVGPQSIQQLQVRRLLSTSAPDRGALFMGTDEALAWLKAQLSSMTP
jgi:hypothetical protein